MLETLYQRIETRRQADPATSYTATLAARGRAKIAQKVGEEAVETIIAATRDNRSETIAESADLLYHLCLLWADCHITPADVAAELTRREGQSGLDEKANRKRAL